VGGAVKGLQFGTKQSENFLTAIPESDATAESGFSKAGAARGLEEHAAGRDDVITKEQALLATAAAFQGVTALLVGLFWWSYTSTVADVSALQGDVRTIMVEAAKSSTSLEGNIETVGTAVGRRIDSLGMIIGNRIDKLEATNSGQFQLITERLDDLRERVPKPK